MLRWHPQGRRRDETQEEVFHAEKANGSRGGSNPKLARSHRCLPKISICCARGVACKKKQGCLIRSGGAHHQSDSFSGSALVLVLCCFCVLFGVLKLPLCVDELDAGAGKEDAVEYFFPAVALAAAASEHSISFARNCS